MEDQMMQQEVDPKVAQEVDSYIAGLSKLMHSPETSARIVEMLKSNDPAKSIPAAALTINARAEEEYAKSNGKPSLDVLLNAGAFIVNDLIEIGNAAGLFQLETEEEIAPILQDTMQQYIEKGLDEGSIDPVELQQKVEPLMNDEHRALGMEAASRSGIPDGPNQNTAMESYGRKMQHKGMLRGQQEMKGSMQNAQQVPQQGGA